MTVNKDKWDDLVKKVEKIEGDLSDVGFMIEFTKIWNEVKDFVDSILVPPKETKLCIHCEVKPSEIGGYCEECNILAWQERRRARGKDLESEVSKNEEK